MEYFTFNKGSMRKMELGSLFLFENLSRKRQQEEQTEKSEFLF